MTFDFLEAASERVQRMPLFGDYHIPIISAEDLIICKVAFNRPKDWFDLSNILRIQAGRLDRAYLDHWLVEALDNDPRVTQFNALADRHDVWRPQPPRDLNA